MIISIDFADNNTGIAGGWKMGSTNIDARTYRTTNGGNNWNLVTVPAFTRVMVSVEFINAQTVYAGGAYNTSAELSFDKFFTADRKTLKNSFDNILGRNQSINYKAAFFKSTDGGISWSRTGNIPSEYNYFNAMDFLNSATGVAVGNIQDSASFTNSKNNILKTTDGGVSWTAMLPVPITGDMQSIQFFSENLIFASGIEHVNDSLKGIVLISTNGGAQWSRYSLNYEVHKVVFVNSSTGFLTAQKNGGYIFKTTNQGSSWNIINTINNAIIQGINFYQESGVGIVYGNSGTETINAFAVRTLDFGATWSSPQSFPVLYDAIIVGNCMLSKYNYYITGGTLSEAPIFHTTNGGSVGIGENPELIPQKFSLEQNYPNPFNPSTIIKYTVPNKSSVILKIYNINGKEIKTLVNEIKSEGVYEVKFDASDLSTGLYYYKLISPYFSETRKMIFIK